MLAETWKSTSSAVCALSLQRRSFALGILSISPCRIPRVRKFSAEQSGAEAIVDHVFLRNSCVIFEVNLACSTFFTEDLVIVHAEELSRPILLLRSNPQPFKFVFHCVGWSIHHSELCCMHRLLMRSVVWCQVNVAE